MAAVNPWQVESIEAFVCLKCPECEFDTKEENCFQDHATENHPLSFVFFGKKDKDSQLLDTELPENIALGIKSEPLENESDSTYMAHDLEEEETQTQNTIEDQEYFNTLGGYDGKNNHIKCKFCEYTCLRKNLMKSHIAIVHDGMKPYQCTMCNYSAGAEGNLRKHIEEVHEQKKPHECKICHTRFSRKERLKWHIQSIHEKKKLFKCSACGYECLLKGNMKSHTDRTHKGEEIEIIYLGDEKHCCTLCSFSSGLKSELNKHIHEVHDGKQDWSCKICKMEFNRKDNLKQHIAYVHEGKKRSGHQTKFPCMYECGKTFFRRCKMIEHIEAVHERKNINVEKDISESFSSHHNEDFQQNSSGNLLDEKFIESEFAESEFTEEPLIDEPITELYEPEENEDFQTEEQINLEYDPLNVPEGSLNYVAPFLCDRCNINFPTKFDLNSHIAAVHDGKKSFICNTCGVRFAVLSRLKEHVANVHEKKKPFKCSLCDYCCFYKGNMNKHINLKHPGETVEILYVTDDPFKCSFCEDFSCVLKSDLKQHELTTHCNEEGQWICTLCNSTYNRKDNLKSHIDTVHKGKKKFFCELCNKGFLRKIHLQTHIAGVHGENGWRKKQNSEGIFLC